MLTKLIGLMLLIFNTMVLASDGGVDGGGGNGVVCRDSSDSITTVRMLDLYEGEILYSLQFSDSFSTVEKALRINLDEKKYGTIAEIGAGQEVARHFFQAGAAAGTIAKTISAYDMQFSDAIYGLQEGGRYVSKARVEAMLDKEFELVCIILFWKKNLEKLWVHPSK